MLCLHKLSMSSLRLHDGAVSQQNRLTTNPGNGLNRVHDLCNLYTIALPPGSGGLSCVLSMLQHASPRSASPEHKHASEE